jgi:hypothetical protein
MHTSADVITERTSHTNSATYDISGAVEWRMAVWQSFICLHSFTPSDCSPIKEGEILKLTATQSRSNRRRISRKFSRSFYSNESKFSTAK